MAYFSQDDKKVVSAAVKPILKKYGVKGSLSVRNHSTVVLTLTAGKVDFFKDGNIDPENRKWGIDVNPYWFQDHYSGKSLKFLAEIIPALKSAGWYDDSDIQTDYFNTAYYFDVKVGNWKKPYQVTQ